MNSILICEWGQGDEEGDCEGWQKAGRGGGGLIG